jgi:hypothetical protein
MPPHFATPATLHDALERPGGEGNIRRSFIFGVIAKDPINLIIGSLTRGLGQRLAIQDRAQEHTHTPDHGRSAGCAL